MFTLSNAVIEPKPSSSFIRLFFLVHCLTGMALLNCGLPVVLKSGFLLFLVLFFLLNYKNAYPVGHLKCLVFLGNHWLVEMRNGTSQTYDKHTILLDTGLFFLLRLTGENDKTLLIFFDQLEEDAYRWLRILEKCRDGE